MAPVRWIPIQRFVFKIWLFSCLLSRQVQNGRDWSRKCWKILYVNSLQPAWEWCTNMAMIRIRNGGGQSDVIGGAGARRMVVESVYGLRMSFIVLGKSTKWFLSSHLTLRHRRHFQNYSNSYFPFLKLLFWLTPLVGPVLRSSVVLIRRTIGIAHIDFLKCDKAWPKWRVLMVDSTRQWWTVS